MRWLVLSLFLVCAFDVQAQELVAIEKDAVIYKTISPDAIDALAAIIRLYGYKCDSISAATPNVFSEGYTVHCNHYNYEYEVLDRGGTWVACWEECN